MNQTPMTARFAQASMTLLTHKWQMLGLALICVPMGAGLIHAAMAPPSTAMTTLKAIFVGAFPAGFGALIVAQHGKWFFVHPRSRLTPGYVAPHIGLLAGLLLACAVAAPLAGSLVLRASPLGLVAYGLAAAASVLWTIQAMSFVMGICNFALVLSLLYPPTLDFWLDRGGEHQPMLAAVLLAGAAGVALWLRRLAMAREGDSDYALMATDQSSGSRFEKSEARRAMARRLAAGGVNSAVIDWWLNRRPDRVPQHRSGNAALRRGLLPYGSSPLPPLVRAVFIATMVAVCVAAMLAVLAYLGNRSKGVGIVLIVPAMGWLLCVSQACMLLAQRRPRMQHELLWPLSRRDYVAGLSLSVWRDLAYNAVACLLLIGLFAAYVVDPYPSPVQAAATLAIAAAISPAVHAATLRIALVQNAMWRLLVLISLLYLVAGVAAGCFAVNDYYGLTACLAACFVVAVVGVVVDRWAMVAWMRAELGR